MYATIFIIYVYRILFVFSDFQVNEPDLPGLMFVILFLITQKSLFNKRFKVRK